MTKLFWILNNIATDDLPAKEAKASGVMVET